MRSKARRVMLLLGSALVRLTSFTGRNTIGTVSRGSSLLEGRRLRHDSGSNYMTILEKCDEEHAADAIAESCADQEKSEAGKGSALAHEYPPQGFVALGVALVGE